MLNNKIDELAQLVLRYCSIKTPVHLIRSVSLRHFKFPTTQKFKRQFSKAFRSGRIHAFLWRKQLSLHLFRLSVGPGKLALIAALAWVVVYPIMENRPEQAIASLPSAANSATLKEMVPKSSESTITDLPAISIELAAFELQDNPAQDSSAETIRQTDSMLRITELEQDLADTRTRLQESETALAFSREALKLTQTSAEKPMPLQPQETTITPAQTPHQTEQFSTSRVDTLLSRANRLMDLKLFTSPVGNNAYEIYQQVLAQDPGNTAAMQGIERITAQYIRWAENSKRASDWLNARNYYRKALIVAPSNPTAEAGLQEVLFIQGQTTDG